MLVQKYALEIDVIFMKQTSVKWNVGSKSEKQYETEMSTCETNYLEMCNNLFQKSEIFYFTNVWMK